MNKAIELAVHVISEAIANEPAIAADISKLIQDVSGTANTAASAGPVETVPPPATTAAPQTNSTPAPAPAPAAAVFTGQISDPAR